MNRKFVKENKKELREFLGSIISKVVGSALTRNIDRDLDKYPGIKKSKDSLLKVSSELDKRLAALKKSDPEFYKKIQSRRTKLFK
jgi:hypothetical protein|tara:strand:- start:715 stop:969 length:255 start_codon:yes stop_codon:yes gene_type:complete